MPIENLTTDSYLPNLSEHMTFRTELVILAARILVERVPVFARCKAAAIKHIPHQYSNEMARKSEQVVITDLLDIMVSIKFSHRCLWDLS